MTATRSGIPTTHGGTNFRSRLEARWAAFFDLVGWSWVYEPFDAAGYIPDFLIAGEMPFFVEVGPCITREDYVQKSMKPARAAAELGHDVLVLGVSPLPQIRAEGSSGLVAGLLGELQEAGPCEEPCHQKEFSDHVCLAGTTSDLWFENAVWAGSHNRLGVYHCYGWYQHRPDGIGHEDAFDDAAWLEALWRRAGNEVQWQAERPKKAVEILRPLNDVALSEFPSGWHIEWDWKRRP